MRVPHLGSKAKKFLVRAELAVFDNQSGNFLSIWGYFLLLCCWAKTNPLFLCISTSLPRKMVSWCTPLFINKFFCWSKKNYTSISQYIWPSIWRWISIFNTLFSFHKFPHLCPNWCIINPSTSRYIWSQYDGRFWSLIPFLLTDCNSWSEDELNVLDWHPRY